MKTKDQQKTITKSQQLAALEAKKETAWQIFRASNEGLQTKGPLGKAWSKINRQTKDLEQSFVVYRGEEIETVTVALQGGDLTTSLTSHVEAEERLHRAADGSYYLWQELWNKKPTVRKLTLKGALLWAVVRVNIKNPALLDDVTALFKKGGVQ